MSAAGSRADMSSVLLSEGGWPSRSSGSLRMQCENSPSMKMTAVSASVSTRWQYGWSITVRPAVCSSLTCLRAAFRPAWS
jgi:hypothetical protein